METFESEINVFRKKKNGNVRVSSLHESIKHINLLNVVMLVINLRKKRKI